MKTIPLSVTGKKYAGMYETIVDDEDFDYLSQWTWSVHVGKTNIYAYRKVGRGHIFMHQAILPNLTGVEVDHKDGNGLDNRRENLRACTHYQNISNRRVGSDNTSVYTGVSFDKRYSKWRAQICIHGTTIRLGCFPSSEGAARAYDAAAIQYRGEYAKTNL